MQTPSIIKHNDAISLLEPDHQVVSFLFKKYENPLTIKTNILNIMLKKKIVKCSLKPKNQKWI